MPSFSRMNKTVKLLETETKKRPIFLQFLFVEKQIESPSVHTLL